MFYPLFRGGIKGGEELVAVVFVLFMAGGDFGGQAVFEIADQRFEAVEDGDDFFLDVERWNRDKACPSNKAYLPKTRTDGVL